MICVAVFSCSYHIPGQVLKPHAKYLACQVTYLRLFCALAAVTRGEDITHTHIHSLPFSGSCVSAYVCVCLSDCLTEFAVPVAIFAVLCFIYHLESSRHFHILSIFAGHSTRMIYDWVFSPAKRRHHPLTRGSVSFYPFDDNVLYAYPSPLPPSVASHTWCNLDKWSFFIFLMLIIS